MCFYMYDNMSSSSYSSRAVYESENGLKITLSEVDNARRYASRPKIPKSELQSSLHEKPTL